MSNVGNQVITRVRQWHRDQRGITGLETAIILIAFVVVSSVFAYTVLSAGIFSSEKGKEAIHSGLESARGSVEVVGSIMATAVAATELHDADVNWTAAVSQASASNDATVALDTSDRKEGTGAVDITFPAGFTTGLAAYKDIASVDVTTHFSAQLWIKSDINTAAGDVRLVIDEGAGCSAPEETLSLPALTANTWKHALLKMTTPSALNAVLCVGLRLNTDLAAQVLTVDLVEAPAEVTQLDVIITNSLEGEPVNLTTTTAYDDVGNVVQVTDPRGNDTQFIINELNQVVRSISRPVEAAGVLHQRSSPCDRECQEQCVETRVVETFAGESAGGQDDPFLVFGERR